MISETQSFVNIGIAAAISTTLFLAGLRQTQKTRAAAQGPLVGRKRRRWIFIFGGIVGAVMSGVVAVADQTQPAEIPGGVLGLIAALSAALVFAAWLVRLGLRGKRVGDHPHCRACGFDLFGRPVGSTVCSECGASLVDEDEAVAVGLHHRRMVPLAIGLFVIIFCLAVSAPSALRGYRAAGARDWSGFKPESWLVSDATFSAGRPSLAMNELDRRLNEGKLSGSTIRRVIDGLLASPPAPAVSGGYPMTLSTANWFAEKGWASGKIDEAEVRKVLRALLAVRMQIAPQAARGHTLRYHILTDDWILARVSSQPITRLSIVRRADTINGIAVPDSALFWSPFPAQLRAFSVIEARDAIHLKDLAADLQLGKATLESRLTLEATMTVPNRPTLSESCDVTLSADTQIVEAAAMRCPPVTQIALDRSLSFDDPTNVEAARHPVVVDSPDPLPVADAQAEYYRVGMNEGVPAICVNSMFVGAMFGEAVLRVDGGERSLGIILIDGREGGAVDVHPLPTGPFELLIKPMPELGTELFNVIPTYQKPIVLKYQAP